MARVVVLGAGIMGLAAAHRAAQLGHDVDVLEADGQAGGMAAQFEFAGVSIERFYHFVCRSDAATFALMAELGIGHKLQWVPTSMAYYIQGRLHDWGTPGSLLRIPAFGPDQQDPLWTADVSRNTTSGVVGSRQDTGPHLDRAGLGAARL